MSNREIHIYTHTGSDGIAHVDIPVGIADQDIEVTVSYSTVESTASAMSIPSIKKERLFVPDDFNFEESSGDKSSLKEILATAKPVTDLSEFSGTLELTEDPLDYQRRTRDEW